MSTDLLQRELTQIAERAPLADVPADTWQRARRSVRRSRIASVAGAAAVVALVAGVATWLPQPDTDVPVTQGLPGVPREVRSVQAGELTATTDLAVGQQSVLLTSESGQLVVVDARDGRYRAVELPGYHNRESSLDRSPVSLSPDGLRLAWAWTGGAGMQDGIGIRVADLTTGSFVSYDLTDGDRAPYLSAFIWSPDGGWLVWDGMRNGEVAGRVGPDGVSDRVPRTDDEDTKFAVGDDGTVLITTREEAILWDGRVLSSTPRTGGWAPVAQSLATGVTVESDWTETTARYRRVGGEPVAGWENRRIYPVGYLSDGTLAALVGSRGQVPLIGQEGDYLLQLLDPGSGEPRTVGSYPPEVIDVASALMTRGQPTVARAVPERPDEGWRPDVSLLIGLGVAAALSVLYGLRWLWRRYRAAR